MDVRSRRGGLLVYIKSSLPSKGKTSGCLLDFINYHSKALSDLLDLYSNEYDNKIVLGDFNLEPSSPSMLSFIDSQNFVNLLKNKACLKGTGSCIDLILTN